MMPTSSPSSMTTRWRKPPCAIASAAFSRSQSPSAKVAREVRWSRTSSLSGSSPAPSERTTSRSVTIPGPGSSGSMITTAPTLWSVMNFAASRSERPGVMVSTCSVMASRTLMCGTLQMSGPHGDTGLPQGLSDLRDRVLPVVEDRRAQGGVGARLEPFDEVRRLARATGRDDRHVDRLGDGADEVEVVAVLGAVPVHRGEHDLPRPPLHTFPGPRHRVAVRRGPAPGDEHLEAVVAPLGVDGEHH